MPNRTVQQEPIEMKTYLLTSRRKCLQWAALLACMLWTVFSYSQEITPNESSDWQVEEFTLPGGTNGNLVTAITEGPNGYMWFGSFAGLHRYDGHEFVTYNDAGNVDTTQASTGLTFPSIEHLFWDSRGQLWISTFGGGAFHFDPQTEIFTRYLHDAQDTTTLSNNFVHGAAEDANGNIWIASRTGVSKLDQSTGIFKHYKTDINKPSTDQNNRVRVLYLDKQGTLWATAGEIYQESLVGGLFKYNPATDAFEGYFPNPTVEGGLGYAPIRGMHEDSEGNFWIGTFYGLQKMDRRTGIFTDMPYDPNQPHAPDVDNRNDAPVWAFHEDQNKGLWMGTVSFSAHDSNVSRYDPVNHTTESFPISTMAWDITESSDGTVWVAGSAIQGVVHRISRQKNKHDLQQGQDVVEVLNDLRRIDGSGGGVSIRNFNIDERTNTLWAERNTGGSSQIELHTGTVNLVSKDLKSGKIKSYKFEIESGENINPGWASIGLEFDDDGNVWFPAKYGGLIKFNPDTGKREQFRSDAADSTTISSNDIVYLTKDSRGHMWAASYKEGLNRINTKTGTVKQFHFITYDENNSDPYLRSDFPIAVLEDRDGIIWVGGTLDVVGDRETAAFLAKINPDTDKITYVDLPYAIGNNSIRFLAQDPVTGNIAFSLIQQGFCVYDMESASIKFYDFVEGRSPFSRIAGLMYDDNGYLWLSNYSADEYARVDLSTDNVYMFESTKDINFSANNRHAQKNPAGHILFKNNYGWAEIDPKVIIPQEVTRTGTINLINLSVSGEKQNYLSHETIDTIIGEVNQINLNHTAESFILKFTDFNYSPIKSNYYYRLYPYEEEFRQATNGPMANYFKVPPGEYEFQVNATSPKGTIIEPLNVSITIHPPWWKTWWAYTLYIIGAGLLGWFGYKTQKERTIRIEREKSKDRELAQAKEIEKAYSKLKATQAQLIQSEKMASLGELTAGIAHEIQNPLNFVNNFSDLSSELIDEVVDGLKGEGNSASGGQGAHRDKEIIIKKENLDDVKDILSDLKGNLEKISHHGGRASSIVKGMLDHSRTDTGEKVPTDINALCDEYLRLSYHGLRAKDSSFNCGYETHFHDSIPLIDVVPQDIGRVLLNIINNAFYSVSSKALATEDAVSSTPLRDQPGFKPMVSISTQQLNSLPAGQAGSTTITIKDNGIGMSQETIEKVFQPFFTTKPTGQGTGLGMSISYDIVTKGHGGDLKVKSVEGEGSQFIIELPN